VAKVWIAAEAFEQFYGIKETELAATLGAVGRVALDQAGAEQLAAGLRALLGGRAAG